MIPTQPHLVAADLRVPERGTVFRLRELLTDSAVWGLLESQCIVPALDTDNPLEVAMTALKEATRLATDTVLVYDPGRGLAEPSSMARLAPSPFGAAR